MQRSSDFHLAGTTTATNYVLLAYLVQLVLCWFRHNTVIVNFFLYNNTLLILLH